MSDPQTTIRPADLRRAGPTSAGVTIAIIPRERNSMALAALEALLECTPEPFELVYVDSRLPRRVRAAIDDRTRRRSIPLTCIRSTHHIGANRARRLALERARTEYVVFLDNDAFVSQGWLTPLVECANQRRATAVTPAIIESHGGRERIHLTGGRLSISARRTVDAWMRDHRRPLAETLSERTQPEPTSLAEFHCLLVHRAEALACELIDPDAPPAWEHIDFGLAVAKHGGTLYVEPRSRVTVIVPSHATIDDVLRFRWQWSVRRHRLGMAHFCRKWQVQDTYPPELLRHRHRSHLVYPGLEERWAAFARRALPQPAVALVRRLYPRRVPGS